MKGVTIHQLRCFDAVIAEGSFQAAAMKLHRTHPTICTAVKGMEDQLGFSLLDRSGYRVTLTEAGQAFHLRTQRLLHEIEELGGFASYLAAGEELELRVVVGDVCPIANVVQFLRAFFAGSKTRLQLHVEAISGPLERLVDNEADLIIHSINRADPRVECIELDDIALVPVVAPGFLGFPVTGAIEPRHLRDHMQCIIRDTGRHGAARPAVPNDAPHYTAGNQFMKKEIILQGMAWGYLPQFMVQQELAEGRLLSIAGRHLHAQSVALVAARQSNRPHGPVANRLWRHIADNAASLGGARARGMAREAEAEVA